MKTARITPILLLFILSFFSCEENPPTSFVPTNFDPSIPWQRMNGPSGGSVLSVAISRAVTLTGTNSGLFLSTDQGGSWSPAATTNPLYNAIISKFVQRGDSIFALSGYGVFLSTDDGASWTEFGFLAGSAYAMTISDSGIYAGTGNGVYLLTEANGKNWVPTGLKGFPVYSLASRGSTVFAGTYGLGFVRSTDNGATWMIANSGLSGSSIYDLAVVGAHLLAGTDVGVFLSLDDGSHWKQVGSGTSAFLCFTVHANRILAGTGNGIYQSTDNGSTWNLTGIGLENESVGEIAASGKYCVAATNDGPYVSTDDGGSWTLSNSGLTNTDVRDIFVSGPNLLASVGNKGIFFSNDQGDHWTQTNVTDGYAVNFIQCEGYDFVSVSGKIIRSSDNGKNWYSISDLPTGGYLSVSSMAGTSTRLYAGTYDGIYISDDHGLSWTNLRPRFKNSNIYILAADDKYVFAGGYDGVYRSSDNGITWTEMVFDIPYPQFSAIGICRATVFLSLYGGGTYCSNDHGANWQLIESDALQNRGVEEFLLVGTDIFASTYNDILVSHDNGGSWTQTGIGNSSVAGLAADAMYLYAASSYSGIWRHPL